MTRLAEAHVEDAALGWLRALGWDVVHGSDLGCGGARAERSDPGCRDVLLVGRLRRALARLNPHLPAEALDEACRKLTRVDGPSLMERNRALHRLLVNGVTVDSRRADGSLAGTQVQVLDFAAPEANDWLAVNQFTVAEGQHARRADVVLFVNGLPLGVLELKHPLDEEATIARAHGQLATYQAQIPALFTYNVALVVSDGLRARVGALGAGLEWFKPWRTIGGDEDAPARLLELAVLLQGLFERRRFLDLVRHFVVFEQGDDGRLVKKIAGYHQFHAVDVALQETLRASRVARDDRVAEAPGRYASGPQGGQPGDRRVGVVWHTQGSGKSLTMAFYAGRVILHPEMENPTLVVLTDRNDLDDQLFGTFARCRDLLRQDPVQALDRADLRARLSVASGGVIFTTIQKFFPPAQGDGTAGDRQPLLSTRRNVVVIADEAHRSQYEFGRRADVRTGALRDGFAHHLRAALPNASFIGFTGTPVELHDKNTRHVFGEYISIYDVERAVHDGATVPIFYESRLAQLALRESERPRLDPDFDEATEGEEVERKERLKTRWAQLEALVGTEERVALIARDLVQHFEARLEVMDGKAMVVCMSRRICVAMYRALVALRPDWHAAGDEQGTLKVVMTGSAADAKEWQDHIRTKKRREALAERFRDPRDPFRVVVVRDMWLTGFDAPSLHTMYVDKPMRGHGLMQTIARVNRVFRDKPGGLVVDYLGLADELRQALATYTENKGRGRPAFAQDEAVAALRTRHEVCRALFHGFDWSAWSSGTPQERLALLPAAQEHVLAQPDGQKRLGEAVGELSRAFALSVPHPDALRLRDDVSFFQAVRVVLAKTAPGERRSDEELERAIRQIVSRAVAPLGVVDVFAAAGLRAPDISVLSDEFLAEVRGLPQRNLAVELLRKLLSGEIRARARRNLVQSRSFAELLEQAVRRYQNRALETAQVLDALVQLARDMRAASARGEALGLTDDELAFYDALEVNDSAVKILGEPTLAGIARELVATVRQNVTIDWTVRESVRARLRVIVKRILRRHGYPPDKQEQATRTVLEQAALLSEAWTAAL